MAHQAVYSISVDGNDVSSAFDPLLISLRIRTDDDSTADELTIELDDTGGQILLPRKGASVAASIGWSDQGGAISSFQGFVDEAHAGGKAKRHHDNANNGHVEPHGSRQSGRILTVTAKSVDMTGKAKQKFQSHADSMSFQQAAQQFAQKAGLSVSVDSALGQIQRAYWGLQNESFLAWGTRIARQIGATFKVYGSQAVFVARTGGMSVSGQALTAINAVWGVNLIDWSIAPDLSRPNFGSFETRFYDPVMAQWSTGKASASGGNGSASTAAHTDKLKAPDQDQAQTQSQANATESGRELGGGTVTIDGEPAAQPSAPCNVSGVRPGVDGTYKVSSAEQELTRGVGFLTHLTLKEPSGGAGDDSRG